LLVVQVTHRAEGLDVMTCIAVAIEATRHEVSSAVLLKQSARHHIDARGNGHLIVGEFDSPVVLGRAELMVFAHAIEFEQPMLEALRSLELPRSNLVRFGIPGDHGFSAGAACGGADL